MNRPLHAISESRRSQMSPERIVSIGFVVALHIALIYALITGLAQRIALQLPKELQAVVIPVQEQETQPPPPQAQLQKPTLPTIAPPEIQVQQQQQVQTPITVQTAPQPTTPVAPVNPSPVSTNASGIMNTHTIPPYPEMERRMGREGTVTLRIQIDTTGNVTDAQVENSSGDQALDQAAVDWVKAHWKYKPAIQNGTAVAATSEAAVKFSLKTAR